MGVAPAVALPDDQAARRKADRPLGPCCDRRERSHGSFGRRHVQPHPQPLVRLWRVGSAELRDPYRPVAVDSDRAEHEGRRRYVVGERNGHRNL